MQYVNNLVCIVEYGCPPKRPEDLLDRILRVGFAVAVTSTPSSNGIRE